MKLAITLCKRKNIANQSHFCQEREKGSTCCKTAFCWLSIWQWETAGRAGVCSELNQESSELFGHCIVKKGKSDDLGDSKPVARTPVLFVHSFQNSGYDDISHYFVEEFQSAFYIALWIKNYLIILWCSECQHLLLWPLIFTRMGKFFYQLRRFGPVAWSLLSSPFPLSILTLIYPLKPMIFLGLFPSFCSTPPSLLPIPRVRRILLGQYLVFSIKLL